MILQRKAAVHAQSYSCLMRLLMLILLMLILLVLVAQRIPVIFVEIAILQTHVSGLPMLVAAET